MKNKKTILIGLMIICMFMSINNVFAVTFDSTCASKATRKTECDKCTGTYWNNSTLTCSKDYCAVPNNEKTPCGRRGNNCSLNAKNECVMSDYAKTSYSDIDSECAANAASKSECDKCTGTYWYWNNSTLTCSKDYCAVPDNEKTPCGMRGKNCSLNAKNECVMSDYAKASYEGSKIVIPDSCLDVTSMSECKNTKKRACVWVDKTTGKISTKQKNGYCNVDKLQYVQCGSAYDIPAQLPKTASYFYKIIQIAVPVILAIVGMISLLKAIASQKEDEMKKAQASLIKKLIAAVLVFLTLTITKFVVTLAADNKTDSDSISACLDCFLSNKCSATTYYKTNINGIYYCTYLNGSHFYCPSEEELGDYKK